MAKVDDVIGRGLRILCVKDAAQATKAADFSTALMALNQMMRRWEADGLALGWTDVALPTDTMPCPDEALEAICFNLAKTLRPEYGVEMGPDAMQMASDGLAKLRADWMARTYERNTYDDLPTHPAHADRGAFLAGY
jgi:hypothetical protein